MVQKKLLKKKKSVNTKGMRRRQELVFLKLSILSVLRNNAFVALRIYDLKIIIYESKV